MRRLNSTAYTAINNNICFTCSSIIHCFILLLGCLDIIEAGLGVSFGPRPDFARLEGVVMCLDHQFTVQKTSYGVVIEFPDEHQQNVGKDKGYAGGS
jgi:hypothetical protein